MTLLTETAPRARTASPVPSKSWRRLVDSPVFLQLAGVLGVLAALEAVTRLDIIPSRWFPPVSKIWWELLQAIFSGAIWPDVAHTLVGWAVGLGIATVLAVPAGMSIGSSAVLTAATRPIIEFLRPIPSVALIPLAVLLWGIDLETKVFLATFASFWPILIQSIYGVQSVDPQHKQVISVYRLGRLAMFRHVIVPSTFPYVTTGLRISSSIALTLSIIAELVVGASGLGRTIMLSEQSSATTEMYAYTVAAGLLGWLLNVAFKRLERAALHWHPSYREGRA